MTPSSSDDQAARFTSPRRTCSASSSWPCFAFNLLIMALDFPRFELVGVDPVGRSSCSSSCSGLGAYFELDLMKPVRRALRVASTCSPTPGFYFMYFLIVTLHARLIVYVTRWLDYWEILPNEILHHHGPLSDLERFPTMNLKFDKEIPDVLEYFLLGAGRLVLHVPNGEKSIVLDNVLFINSKEEALKKLMSRLEVRVTTDQEVGERRHLNEHDGEPGSQRRRSLRDRLGASARPDPGRSAISARQVGLRSGSTLAGGRRWPP